VDLGDPTTTALLAAEALDRAGIPHALYGGLLLAAYGELRETRDADFAVVDATAESVGATLRSGTLDTALAFDGLVLGGLLVDRLAILGRDALEGLNVVDLVRSRSVRYREIALRRSVRLRVRGREIRALSPEDFVLFKLLSTRDRDLRDAASVLRRTGGMMDAALLRMEVDALAAEIPDFDVRGRLSGLLRLLEDPLERKFAAGLTDGPSGEVHEMTPAQRRRLRAPGKIRTRRRK